MVTEYQKISQKFRNWAETINATLYFFTIENIENLRVV